jgi:hypothetical protein
MRAHLFVDAGHASRITSGVPAKPSGAEMNRLYFGDNLQWLRNVKEFPDASVDLVYLDPPFNSNADYNVLFRETSGQMSQAQFHAFTDTWSWADAAETYHQFIDTCPNVIKGPTGDWLPSVFTGDSQHIIFDGLTAGTTYTVQIRALGGSTGQSDWSDPSSHMSM